MIPGKGVKDHQVDIVPFRMLWRIHYRIIVRIYYRKCRLPAGPFDIACRAVGEGVLRKVRRVDSFRCTRVHKRIIFTIQLGIMPVQMGVSVHGHELEQLIDCIHVHHIRSVRITCRIRIVILRHLRCVDPDTAEHAAVLVVGDILIILNGPDIRIDRAADSIEHKRPCNRHHKSCNKSYRGSAYLFHGFTLTSVSC